MQLLNSKYRGENQFVFRGPVAAEGFLWAVKSIAPGHFSCRMVIM